MKNRIDHDRLFKELLTTFFVDFIELFLPDVGEYLDAGSLEFLDKEIFTDITEGKRYETDVIVKCRFRTKRELFFLIHTEHQAQREYEFAKRMFRYFSRLTEKYDIPVYPIALFSYEQPRKPEPKQYSVKFPDRVVLEFNYATIQLNRLNWRDYLARENPIASALMSRMGFTKEERVQVKKECLRMIARLRLDPARAKLLSGFVDTYLRLRAEERERLHAEMQKLPPKERKQIMELTTSWKEEGLQQGLQQGLEQGAASIVLRLLQRRLGELKASVIARIEALPLEKLERLSEALLEFNSIKDLNKWLRENAPTRPKRKAQ